MKNEVQTQPATYWSGLRQCESILFGQHAQQISPLFYAEMAVAAWHTGAGDGVDDFDTLAYSGITPIAPWRPRRAILNNFDQLSSLENQQRKRREARVFELMLEPDRERLLVYAAWLPLDRHGLIPDSMPGLEKGKMVFQKFSFVHPTEEDYIFVRDQLIRGAISDYAIDLTDESSQ